MPGSSRSAEWIEVSFLVPITEDAILGSGKLHDYRKWEKLQDELYVRFGGYTVAPGYHHGAYTDPDTGARVADKSVKYHVAIRRRDFAKVRSFLKNHVKMLFCQKSIYCTIGEKVIFV